MIIAHGNRAGALTASNRLPPVIAVAHSRFFKKRDHFAAVIALSEARAKELGMPYIIPNMVHMPNEPRTSNREPRVIGTMGRFSPEKGFDLLLDALAIVRDRGLAFRTVIGGNGALETELKAQASRLRLDITWPGWITDKTAFYDSIDIFCMPSRTESFPITLLEAMAHAKPIVVTDCGGPSAMIAHGKTGLLIAIDVASIADALATILADPHTSLGSAARAEAQARYALPVVAKKLNAIVNLAAQ